MATSNYRTGLKIIPNSTPTAPNIGFNLKQGFYTARSGLAISHWNWQGKKITTRGLYIRK